MPEISCIELHKLLDNWEKTGEIAAPVSSIKNHLEKCSLCRGRYLSLLPLLERDSGLREIKKETPLPEETVQGILEGLTPRRRRPAPLLAAAGFAVVIGLGLLLRFLLPGTPSDTVTLQFLLSAPEANTVFVTGDFNNWDPEGIPLKRKDSGAWEVKLKLKKGIYLYNFIIDGEYWITDPSSSIDVDDGFGGKNSMIKI